MDFGKIMSNGDNVLDNWEEIDEAGLDSKLNKLKRDRNELRKDQHQNYTEQQSEMRVSFENSIPVMMVMQQTENEYNSSNYRTQSMPTVKILRRPTQQNSSLARCNGVRPKQPIKTLQQREQEYAEARLRILGSAKNPEDDVDRPTEQEVSVIELLDSSTMAINLPSSVSTAGIVNIGLDTVESKSFSPGSSTVGRTKTQCTEKVLRMPRGPDGTPGFQMRR